MQDTLVGQIVALEWEMFSRVSNTGGVSPCQLDFKTFGLMRRSQMAIWPGEVLASYLEDLRAAAAAGRNLMSEKYARMMESTHPDEFAKFAGALPEIAPQTRDLVEEIVAANVAWKEDLAARFPLLNDRGRAIRSAEDGPLGTSFETYLRGEFMTYSLRTLGLCREHIRECREQGVNLAEANLLHQVKGYGYASLEDAEHKLRAA